MQLYTYATFGMRYNLSTGFCNSWFINRCSNNYQISLTMQLITEHVNKIIHKIYKNKDPLLAELIIHWPQIAGVKFSNNSMPFKIIRTKEMGKKINILFIEMENHSLSTEMHFCQGLIIERI